jgi:hypothetical protein
MNLQIAIITVVAFLIFLFIKNSRTIKNWIDDNKDENIIDVFFDLIDMVKDNGIGDLLVELKRVCINLMGEEKGTLFYLEVLRELEDTTDESLDKLIKKINDIIPGEQYDIDIDDLKRIIEIILLFYGNKK